MAKDNGINLAQSFFNKNNSSGYDRLVELATLGQDTTWKKQIVKSVPSGSLVLEMACGTGILTSIIPIKIKRGAYRRA